MPKLTYGDIMERLDYFKNDEGLRALQDRARTGWYPLFKMTHKAPLPDTLTRGLVMNMSSPRLRDMVDGLLSVFDSYKVISTIAPTAPDGGEPAMKLKAQADKIERAATLQRSKYDDGGRTRRELFGGLLIGPYVVCIERPLPDGTLSVDIVDGLSCYFPVKRPPFRASEMCRDYEITIKEAEDLYADSPYNKRRKRKPVYGANEPQQWGWVPISDDVAHENSETATPIRQGDIKFGERVRVIWYADDEYTYHILCNSTDPENKAAGGEIVYCEKNTTRGCPAFVLSGSVTTMREIAERMGPALLPLIQCVFNRNLIRTMRMVKSVNTRPDAFIEMSPELFEAAADVSAIIPVGAQAAAAAESVELVAHGDANLISVNGTVKPWVVAPDDHLDKLDEGWKEEEREYINEWREPTDPQTVGDATANAYLTAVEAIRLRQTTPIKDADWLDRNLLDDWLHSIKVRGIEVKLTAEGGELLSAGELSAGQGVTLSAADLDIEYTVNVTTKSQTASEKRALTDAAFADMDRGAGTLEEVIEIKYIDSTAQLKKQAIDAGYRLQRPLMLQHLDVAYRGKVLQNSGIVLPGGPPPMAAPPEQGGGASPMQPAAINGVNGGSGPVGAVA